MKALNASELRVLQMLAQGHTAKSIADLLDVSVHTINERLREARRKTGAQSSRSLARTLFGHVQISCNEQFAVAAEGEISSVDAAGDLTSAAKTFVSKGRAVMASLFVLVGILILSPSTFETDQPARISGITETPVARKLLTRLDSEEEDPTWSVDARHTLGKAYSQLDGLEVVAVRCGTTLCEVSGEVKDGAMDRAIKSTASSRFQNSIQTLGFERMASLSFRQVQEQSGRGSFVAFWLRGTETSGPG